MSPNQKRAWGNIIVWGAFLVAAAILMSVNGTVFFWQEDSLRNTFYMITGVAIVAWFIMMLIVWMSTPKTATGSDERDSQIMSRVNAAAGPIAMTAVAVTALVLMIVYLEDKTSVISPYFLIYIALVNIVVYWLAQGIITLIAYRQS
jgi:cobalamin synthase